MSKWVKGYVWVEYNNNNTINLVNNISIKVNGRNLGRYWNKGP